ncbi:MAG: TIGR02588 family protein [Nostoc sp. SerVER01]|uniref:TIGR02588 family protein n=1 Tax=Nostoc sp. CCY 9925 TaxID=3103865 RepID=UPI002ADC817D|nr:TIGR02588 family protein [Nostoc sp. SerVER01]MDZ8029356.1 TIGR02588 family protein [Nostoc sp. DedQUE11]MDZ8072070.1 TIGR02588 family protein [Nostoc sp. DedQUE01]MDZ8077954.1 TIGR02588 family protein [Nostoc sp. DcaGUA01]
MTKTEQQPKRSLAEWVTFSVASFILAIIVSLVVYTWLNEKNQPPVISVSRKETIREINGQFYVPFEVANTGGDTAESVQIIAELVIDGKVAESGEQQIDFLSSREREEGAFVFSQNPRQGKLNLRIASYKLP